MTHSGLLAFSEKHYILQNHVIKQLRTNSGIECAMHCLRHASCLSLNIRGIAVDGVDQWEGSLRVECQLNAGNRNTFPMDYVAQESSTYYDVIQRSFS